MVIGNGAIQGKRKLIATCLYTIGCLSISSILVAVGKISGQEFISALGTAQYVTLGYLGVNAVGAAVQRFGKNNE